MSTDVNILAVPQGDYYNKRVKVCFNFDTTVWYYGTIVRDDVEDPYVTCIKLDIGNYILGSECQYQIVP